MTITDKSAEAHLRKLNRTYALLSQVNQTIVRVREPQALFEATCRIAVEQGGYRMAWIALLDPQTQQVNPVAHAGAPDGYLEKINIRLDEGEAERGPTSTALLARARIIVNEVARAPYMGPWLANASLIGYRSSGVFPFIMQGQARGTLNLYAAEPDAFDEDEVKLLQEVAEDIAFALEFMEQEQQRRRAELELRTSEQRYQTLAKISPVGIFRTDPDGSTTYVNPKWTEISGLAYDKALGDGWLDAVHPDDKASLRRRWQTSTGNGAASFSDYRMLRPDGTIAWVLGQAVPEVDAENQIIGYVGTITDITEHRQAQAAFQASERQLSVIYANISDILFYVAVEPDDEFRFISVNTAFLNATGLSEEQIVGRLVREVIPEPSLALVLGNYKKAIHTKIAVSWEEVSVYPAGVRYGDVTVVPIVDADGICRHLIGTVHDISERKEVEQELRRSANEFALLYEIAREISAQPDLATLLDIVSDRTARLLNTADAIIYLYDAACDELELAAANLYSLPRGTRFQIGQGVSSQVVRTRQSLIVDDYRTWSERRPELEEFDLRAIVQVPLIYREELIGVLGVAEIGTDRKFTPADTRLMELLASEAAIAIQNARLYAALETSNKELEARVAERTEDLKTAMRQAQESDRLKSVFLATMSHELRTPLNSIIGFSGVLLQGLAGPLNAEQTKQLGMTRDSARHLLALINDVLDISKIEAGQLQVVRAPFDMRAVIENALRSVSPQAEKKGLVLTAAISSSVGIVVSDHRRVEQILLNLLSNAIKFTEQGHVRIDCRTKEGWLETGVHDTGIGIRAEDMSKLFEPFHQLETGLNRRHEGTGLGLAICRNLVSLLGGEIRAESEWGAGSTFTFTLPLANKGASHG